MVVLIEMLFIFVSFQYQNYRMITGDIAAANNTKVLGQALYTTYVYPFEIAAAILLVAMVAAIALTLRPHNRAKYQKPEQQVAVRREERIRLIKMPAEPKD
jgi:NADH-quinone oxidoreductase subunit J